MLLLNLLPMSPVHVLPISSVYTEGEGQGEGEIEAYPAAHFVK